VTITLCARIAPHAGRGHRLPRVFIPQERGGHPHSKADDLLPLLSRISTEHPGNGIEAENPGRNRSCRRRAHASLDLRKSAQPGRVGVPFGALHARRTERCTPASNYALPRGGVAVWDAIEPDEALLVAVARLSTGADVHKLLLASRYRWACEHGFQMLASEIEQKIRRELAKNVQTALARQR
jgi:hypothetical protein